MSPDPYRASRDIPRRARKPKAPAKTADEIRAELAQGIVSMETALAHARAAHDALRGEPKRPAT